MNENTKKVNYQQKESIVDYMQTNYSILHGRFTSAQGKLAKDNKWNELMELLNNLGPPIKKTEQWKKTWNDMRADVKKKLQLKRQNLNQSGAGPINIVFTELEDRIVSICGKQILDGDQNIPEIGFNFPKSIVDKTNENIAVQNSCTLTECDSNLSSTSQKSDGGKSVNATQVSGASTPKKTKKSFYESEESQDGEYM